MNSYKIGDLANILNIKKDTIRYYEEIGLIPKPDRQENGYRLYSEKYIEIIQFIILCKNNGFTLTEISEISFMLSSSDENNKEVEAMINNKISSIDKKIVELTCLKNDLELIVKKCDPNACDLIGVFKKS